MARMHAAILFLHGVRLQVAYCRHVANPHASVGDGFIN